MEEDPDMAAAIAASMGKELPVEVPVDEEAVSLKSDSDKSMIEEGEEVIDTTVVEEGEEAIDATAQAQAIADAEAAKEKSEDKKVLFSLKAERVWVCGENEGEDDQDDVVLVLFRKERIPIKPIAPIKED
jgi:hypothetical protein